MGDKPTDVTGAVIRRIKGADYVVIDVRRMFSGESPSIARLAGDLQISAEAILNSLLANGANAHVVPSLYSNYGLKPGFPGLHTARTELKAISHQFTATGSGRLIYTTDKPFLGWLIDADKPIVLPMSRGFRNVMHAATAKRQREARIRAVTPDFAELEKAWREIRRVTESLHTTIGIYDSLMETNRKELGILEALNGMFQLLLMRPKSPPSQSDKADLLALQARFDRLRAQAQEDMVVSPPDSQMAGMFSRRDLQSREVLRQVRDATFVEKVRVLTNNADVAPATLLHDVCETVVFAYETLLLTPRADEAEKDLRAALDMLASKPFDTSGLTSTSHPAFNAAVAQASVPPATDSALLWILKLKVQAGPVMVGNLPGPSTVGAAVVQMVALLAMPKVMGKPEAAGALGGKLYRGLVVAAGLDGPQGRPQRVALIEATQRGDLSAIRKLNWTSNFMTSQGWIRSVTGANLLAFLFAITTDDSNTLRRFSNIVGTGAGAAVGLALTSFGRYGSLLSRGIIKFPIASALGALAATAAVVSGVITAREEAGAGDMTGAWIAAGTAAGGALSVVGFLIAAGAATSATGVGAPVGAVLMVVGAVVMVGTGVVAAIRGYLTPGSQGLWVTVLEYLNRGGGPLAMTAKERPKLRAAFDDVYSHRKSARFWDVALANANDLEDMGFTVEQISLIVDDTEANVRTQLLTGARP